MDTTSNISKFTSYLTTSFLLDFQENVFRKLRNMYLPGAGSTGARKVCVCVCVDYFYRDMFLKSKMENVVKYDVYSVLKYIAYDIHLSNQILILKRKNKNPKRSRRPRDPGIRTQGLGPGDPDPGTRTRGPRPWDTLQAICKMLGFSALHWKNNIC